MDKFQQHEQQHDTTTTIRREKWQRKTKRCGEQVDFAGIMKRGKSTKEMKFTQIKMIDELLSKNIKLTDDISRLAKEKDGLVERFRQRYAKCKNIPDELYLKARKYIEEDNGQCSPDHCAASSEMRHSQYENSASCRSTEPSEFSSADTECNYSDEQDVTSTNTNTNSPLQSALEPVEPVEIDDAHNLNHCRRASSSSSSNHFNSPHQHFNLNNHYPMHYHRAVHSSHSTHSPAPASHFQRHHQPFPSVAEHHNNSHVLSSTSPSSSSSSSSLSHNYYNYPPMEEVLRNMEHSKDLFYYIYQMCLNYLVVHGNMDG